MELTQHLNSVHLMQTWGEVLQELDEMIEWDGNATRLIVGIHSDSDRKHLLTRRRLWWQYTKKVSSFLILPFHLHSHHWKGVNSTEYFPGNLISARRMKSYLHNIQYIGHNIRFLKFSFNIWNSRFNLQCNYN